MSTDRLESRPLTSTQWLICIISAIGFLFDTYELLMLPLIIRPAMQELLGHEPTPAEFKFWYSMLFFLPAVMGGIFGLLGGYLTDRLGRRRVLTWSILLYAFSALAAAFSTSLPWLVFFRATKFIGVCVEFVAAVAWLAELFPNPHQREKVLGYTQAFGSLGGLLVAVAYGLSFKFRESLPAIQGVHSAWRYTLVSGLIPAIPLIVIRPFLPESPVWLSKKEAGTLRRPSLLELFQPALRLTTIVCTIMFACSLGVAFGSIQQINQVVPGLTDVKQLPKDQQNATTARVQTYQEVGGLIGRCLLAFLALKIASRRVLIRIFQVPGLIITPLVFMLAMKFNLMTFQWGMFFAGLFAVAQLSFWGNYLPHVFPLHLRGTGESFAANVGGRMIGTSAAIATTMLVGEVLPAMRPAAFAHAAAIVGLTIYAIGLVASFWLPEPGAEALPE